MHSYETINGNVRKRGHFGSDLAHTKCTIDVNDVIIAVIIITIRSVKYCKCIIKYFTVCFT